MTMILTCLTKNYIVQASDRRLTITSGRKVKVVEDHSNKALIYNNNFAFAYTGLAKLPTISAIDWAAQRLSEKENMQDAVLHLGNCSSNLMRSSTICQVYSRCPASAKRLAFIGSGFANIEENGVWSRKPLCIIISNFSGEQRSWINQPRDTFKVEFYVLAEQDTFDLFVTGQPLPENGKEQLIRTLKRCVQENVKPEAIGRLLTREIQRTARTNQTVGKNIMCTMVPKQSISGLSYRYGAILLKNPVVSQEPQTLEPAEYVYDQYRFAVPPPFDTPVFIYVPGDSQALPYQGPVLVGYKCVVPPISMGGINLTIPPFIKAPNASATLPM